MIALGINGIDGLFHDSSATLVVENRIVASVEEERFNRIKHSNGIPFHAIDYCLKKGGMKFQDIECIGYYLNPIVLKQVFVDKILSEHPGIASEIEYYAAAAERMKRLPSVLEQRYGNHPCLDFHFVNHHLAHAASAYYISNYEEAVVLTVDGAGDEETLAVFHARGPELNLIQTILSYPKSLGFIYTVLSNHLGLGWIEGPGKLMGLAGYGTPDQGLFNGIILLHDDCRHPIDVDLSFFNYHIGGQGLSQKGMDRFGPSRGQEEPIEQRHMDLAASVQWVLEKSLCHVVSKIGDLLPGKENLCIAGGIGLNVCCNRKIYDMQIFKRIFISPPAYDGGTSLGCALYLNTAATGFYKYNFTPYLGPDIVEDFDIPKILASYGHPVEWMKLDKDSICKKAAELIANNKIIGWIQGRMECGPRALGNRSFLTNPMNPQAKTLLNTTVKRRESFRPYAPSVLQAYAREWFDLEESPYMLFAATVRPEKRHRVPGIVHIDGTTRPHTVTKESNPRFYELLMEFHRLTGVPMVLNTSMNKHGEPIINTPQEAIDNLLASNFAAIFIGDYYVIKRGALLHGIKDLP